MELELGLKLTKVIDDFTSADLLIAKDRADPLFLTSETEAKFILTAHLKGYRRKNIKININEDGSRITISGEKHVQEMVMVGWKMYKKEVEMRGFRKAFIIPNGVYLDKIKAKFNEDESILTISMPKLAKGLVGGGIEEVKEEEIARGESESKEVVDDEVKEKEKEFKVDHGKEFEKLRDKKEEQGDSMVSYQGENQGKESHDLEGKSAKGEEPERKESKIEKAQEIQEHANNDDIHEMDSKMGGKEKEREREDLESQEDQQHDQIENLSFEQSMNENQDDKNQEVEGEGKFHGTENEIQEGEEMVEEDESAREERKRETQREKPNPKIKRKLCVPFFAGSALLVSLIVLVIHLIRAKNKHSNVRAKRQ